LDKAIEHFTITESSYLTSLDRNSIAFARLYNNIGNVFFNKLNYATAIEYYKQAIDIFEKQTEIDILGLADIYYSLANTYFKLRKYDDALSLIKKYYNQSYHDTRLLYLSLEAAIFQELNQYTNAELSYRKAIEYAEELFSDSEVSMVFELLNYSDFLIKSNNLKEAKNELNRAESILNENNISEGLPVSFFYKTQGFFHDNIIVETKNINDFRQQKSLNLLEAIELLQKGLRSAGNRLREAHERFRNHWEYGFINSKS
jgi:tetratricopeptide (TPR) repeat protein